MSRTTRSATQLALQNAGNVLPSEPTHNSESPHDSSDNCTPPFSDEDPPTNAVANVTEAFRATDLPTPDVGIFTNTHLQVIHIELLTRYGIWYCQVCCQNPDLPKRVIGLGTSNVKFHMTDFHKLSKKSPGVQDMFDSLQEYGAWDGSPPTPLPSSTVAPFAFLDIMDMNHTKRGVMPESCGECKGPNTYIWITGTSRSKHLLKHGETYLTACPGEKYPQVQWFTNVTQRNWFFPVNGSLPSLRFQHCVSCWHWLDALIGFQSNSSYCNQSIGQRSKQ